MVPSETVIAGAFTFSATGRLTRLGNCGDRPARALTRRPLLASGPGDEALVNAFAGRRHEDHFVEEPAPLAELVHTEMPSTAAPLDTRTHTYAHARHAAHNTPHHTQTARRGTQRSTTLDIAHSTTRTAYAHMHACTHTQHTQQHTVAFHAATRARGSAVSVERKVMSSCSFTPLFFTCR